MVNLVNELVSAHEKNLAITLDAPLQTDDIILDLVNDIANAELYQFL